MTHQVEKAPLRGRVLDWYREHVTDGDGERAELRLQRSLRRLHELERIDEYLGRLDEDIRQANRRALAFLDYRLRAPDRLDVLLHRACCGALQAPEESLPLPVAPGGLMEEQRLRPPRQKPESIPRSVNASRVPRPSNWHA